MDLYSDGILTDQLRAAGLGHYAPVCFEVRRRHVIYRLDNGREIGRMDCFEAWDFLYDLTRLGD